MVRTPTVFFVCGPTAAGKSDFALALALRLRDDGYTPFILNCDVYQMYTGLPTTTNKPTQQELDSVPHYFINILPEDNPFAPRAYRDICVPLINYLLSTPDAVPIVCGGSHHYMRCILSRCLPDEAAIPSAALADGDADRGSGEPATAAQIAADFLRKYGLQPSATPSSGTPFPASPPARVIMFDCDANLEALDTRIGRRTRKMARGGAAHELAAFAAATARRTPVTVALKRTRCDADGTASDATDSDGDGGTNPAASRLATLPPSALAEGHDLLLKLDPSTAAAVHPNNVRRVSRAVQRLASGVSESAIRAAQHGRVSLRWAPTDTAGSELVYPCPPDRPAVTVAPLPPPVNLGSMPLTCDRSIVRASAGADPTAAEAVTDTTSLWDLTSGTHGAIGFKEFVPWLTSRCPVHLKNADCAERSGSMVEPVVPRPPNSHTFPSIGTDVCLFEHCLQRLVTTTQRYARTQRLYVRKVFADMVPGGVYLVDRGGDEAVRAAAEQTALCFASKAMRVPLRPDSALGKHAEGPGYEVVSADDDRDDHTNASDAGGSASIDHPLRVTSDGVILIPRSVRLQARGDGAKWGAGGGGASDAPSSAAPATHCSDCGVTLCGIVIADHLRSQRHRRTVAGRRARERQLAAAETVRAERAAVRAAAAAGTASDAVGHDAA